MMHFGKWNPKGTSNSEYGKFAFQNSSFGPSQSGGSPSGPNIPGWNSQNNSNHQHVPGCHNYQAQNHQHHPGCANANSNAGATGTGNWSMGQGQGINQVQRFTDENGQNYTIHVGEEAAAAALGGKPNFNMKYSMPQNAFQSQTGNLTGFSNYSSDPDSCNVPSASNQQNVHNMENPATGTDFGGNQSNNTDDNGSGEGLASGQEVPTSAVPKAPETAKPLPSKWRGLPRTGKNPVKFGRHMPPSYAQKSQSQMNMQIQKGMVTMPPNFQVQAGMSGMGDTNNTMMMETEQGQSLGQLPMTSKSMTRFSGSASKPLNLGKANSKPMPTLCGKCPKCKTYLPPSQGPSTMIFPNQSRQKSTIRSMHSMGTQDAKNFRAAQFLPRQHLSDQ